jgi:hypothetical protein
LGILLSSILCTCLNQHNLRNLAVSVIVGFLAIALFLYWLIPSNFLFHCHIPDLKFFNIPYFQKCLFAQKVYYSFNLIPWTGKKMQMFTECKRWTFSAMV